MKSLEKILLLLCVFSSLVGCKSKTENPNERANEKIRQGQERINQAQKRASQSQDIANEAIAQANAALEKANTDIQKIMASSVPKQVIAVSKMFEETMLVCPEKIWPNYNWKNSFVIFVYPSINTAWVWSGNTGEFQFANTSALPPSASSSVFEFFEFQNRPAMSLNMEEDSQEIFEYGVHEFFHDQGQKNWIQDVGVRGTEYPVKFAPRLQRRYLFDNLKAALLAKGNVEKNQYLSRASYWFSKWKSDSPEEFLVSTDGYEGTAEYVEIMALAISEVTCKASENELFLKVKEIVAERSGDSVSGESLMLDDEGYDIGGIATILLRFGSSDFKQVTKQLEKNASPVLVLLAGSQPSTEEFSLELVDKFTRSADRANADLDQAVGPDIKNFSDKKYLRLSVPHDWLLSNLMPSGFITSKRVPEYTIVPLMLEHRFQSPNNTSQLVAQPGTVFFLNSVPATAVCGDQEFVLIERSSVHISNNDRLRVQTSNVDANLKGYLAKDPAGFEYFCSKD